MSTTSSAGTPVTGSAMPISAPAALAQHFALKHVCAIPAAGHRGCFALKRVRTGLSPAAAAAAAATPSGYGPTDFASAYNMPSTGGSGVTVAIVDAYNDPTAESDLAFYRSTYKLPACTTANGCFSKVSQTGSSSSLPTTDTGWSGEIALDIEMVSASCPNCHILLVEARSTNNSDLDIAVNYAAAHAQVVSNSYGGREYIGEASDSAYSHPGVSVLASSGDDGYVVEFPAASPTVIAVGGTRLSRSSATRGWTESTWNTSDSEGAGSGCSTMEPKPAWQHDAGCAKRTVADISAMADSVNGVAVYDTTGGSGWDAYGGTSVSAPLVAGILSTTGHAGVSASYLYANPNLLYDVTTGQTASSCTSYLCKAGAGYDGPTGLGTPNGALLAGSTPAPANDFGVTLSPASGTEVAGNSVTAAVSTTTTSGATQSVTLSVSGLPAGVTGTFSPASVTSGGSSSLTLSSTSSAAPGTSALTITGTAASGAHSAGYSLTVTKPVVVNDFSVAASAASVTAGSSGSSTITTTTTSGPAQTVTLAASGAPAGVSVTFNPASLTSGSRSAATIAVAAGTAAGSYSITVTGSAVSGSHSAAVALTVKAAPKCAGGQKLLNPGFESGADSWTATPGVIANDGAYGHAGNGYVWLDGYGSAHTDTLSQVVTMPAGCTSVVLSFWLNVTTGQSTQITASDKLTVCAGNAVVATYSNLTATGYAQRSVTLNAAAGTSIMVGFNGAQSGSSPTSFFIDDTALTFS